MDNRSQIRAAANKFVTLLAVDPKENPVQDLFVKHYGVVVKGHWCAFVCSTLWRTAIGVMDEMIKNYVSFTRTLSSD